MSVRHTRGPGNHGYLKGGNRSNEYQIWCGIRQRCYNPRCREYPYYGGRGIRVCDRWREANGFANFLADVGPQPFRRASLHRVDNDGDYEPGNVIWTDAKTQMRNMRGNRFLTLGGRSQILVEWAEELGIKPVTLAQRLYKGWSEEDALTRPVKPRRPYEEWVQRNPNPKKRGPKPRHPASPARQPTTPRGLALAAQRSTDNAAGDGTPGGVSDRLSGVARNGPQ